MKWLHISDIHFNFNGYDSNNVRDKLVLKLEELKLDIDFILITGDCLYKYGKNGGIPQDVEKYIKQIAKACHCSKKRIYICQGNHDVDRDSNQRNELIKDIRDGSEDFDEHYEQLNRLANEKFQMIVHNVTGYDYDSYKIFSPSKKNFRVISLNSALTSKDKNDCGNLKLCNEKLLELRNQIANDERINILIMHHGIEFIEPKDARKFEHWIEDSHIDMVFCGHTHRAAVETCDDTYRDIKQFTAGAIVVDGYAIPSFYLCEHVDEDDVIVKLFTYSKETEKWDLDNHSLRKFKHGIYKYRLSRKWNNKKDLDILGVETCKELISKLNKAYETRYQDRRMRSENYDGYDEFNSSKIISSLSEIGMPYEKAIDITSKVVQTIASDGFLPKEEKLSIIELKEVIYNTIVTQKADNKDKEFIISCWASRYARRYNRHSEITIQTHNNKEEKLDYIYIHDTLLKHIFDKITGNEIFYLKTFKTELKHMSEEILAFLKNMGVFEIREEVLNNLVEEYMTQKPHPWLVNNNKKELLKYHIEQANNHIIALKNNADILISQTEAAYHICAAFLLQYDKFLGSKETSPIVILKTSINELHGEVDTTSGILPVQRYQLVQLKKDFEKNQINFVNFEKHVNTLYEYIVDRQVVTAIETQSVLFKLWDMLNKLLDRKPYDEKHLLDVPLDRIRYIFDCGTGFIVKDELKSLKTSFWVAPNWEIYETKQQHLGSQLLVSVIDSVDGADSVYDYLYEQNRKDKDRVTEVVFALSNYASFTSQQRDAIREKFKGKSIKCIFIQEDNYKDISEKNNWRDVFFSVICRSRTS